MSSTPPRIRGYRVEGLLGTGSHATVWRATPRDRGPAVALKYVPRRLGDVLLEAGALAALDHPNLIKVRAVHRRRHCSVLVLDLAAGGTLAQLLARRISLPPGEVVAALTPIASALAAVHAAGLVHGDLSPANVLFGADGLPLLSDLGSAYWLEEHSPGSLPAPGFADPLAEHGVVTGHAGDIFSLAAIAYAALTGSATPCLVSLAEVARREYERRCAIALEGTPEDLRQLVLGALALDPRHRPTAVEFAARLRFTTAMTGVDLHAGRHTKREALPVITRGARVPFRAPEDQSPFRRRRLRHRASRDRQPHRLPR